MENVQVTGYSTGHSPLLNEQENMPAEIAENVPRHCTKLSKKSMFTHTSRALLFFLQPLPDLIAKHNN